MLTVVVNPVYGTEKVINATPTVMTSSPTVNFIFWGSNWKNVAADATLASNMVTAFKAVLNSTFLNATKEYGTTGSAVFGASYVDSASDPPTGYDDSGAGGATSQTAMQNEIANVINTAGSGISGPSGNNILTAPLYVVMDPPEAAVTNGGYNVPGTFSGNAINMISVGTSGSVVDFDSITFSHELAERTSDPKEDGTGAVFDRPTALPDNDPPFDTHATYQMADGEAEPDNSFHYSYRQGGINGAATQFVYSASTKSLSGIAGTWIAADGNSQTLYLDPIWDTSNPSVPVWSGTYNLTIDGDQLASKDDNITLAATQPSAGGTGLAVTLDGEQYHFDPNTITNVTINGMTGTNTLTLDFTDGNFLSQLTNNGGSLSFDGGTGPGGTLVLKGGSFTNETDSPTGPHAGTITLDGNKVTYSDLAPIIDTASATNFSITDPTASDTINVVDDPSSPQNAFTTDLIDSNSSSFEPVEFANKSHVAVNSSDGSNTFNLNTTKAASNLAVLALTGGAGADNFNVLHAPSGAAVNIDGGAGGNTLTAPTRSTHGTSMELTPETSPASSAPLPIFKI